MEEEIQDDIDDLLENDDDFTEKFREKRLRELKQELFHVKDNTTAFGSLLKGKSVPENDKDLLQLTIKTPKLIVAFIMESFKSCVTLQNYLEAIATQHPSVLFAVVSAEKYPFIVTKLNIKVLPAVIMFMDGIAIDRFVGFDELTEATQDEIEKRISKCGIFDLRRANKERK